MTIDDIKSIIRTGETRTLELKKTTGELKDGMHTACAFLNTDGGWLVFGVTPKSLKIVGLRRIEQLEIPVEALREALVNALCHRRYDQPGTSVGIAVYDDRVEIENPGALPPELTPETIKQPHNSHPYNPLIATFLYRSTFLESWGSGVRRIVESCADAGVEEPIWQTNPNFVWVTFKRLADKSSYINNVVNTENEVKKGQGSEKGQGSKKGQGLKAIDRLIEVMSFEYVSVPEIMEKLRLKNRTKFTNSYIIPAINQGIIERKYSDQPFHPYQRFRLTEKAMHLKYFQATQNDSTKSSMKSSMKSEETVIATIKENPRTTLTDLMTTTGLSKAGVRKIIDRLKKRNVIQRVGPDKGGHWEIINQIDNV